MNYEEYRKLVQRLLSGDFDQATPKERDEAVFNLMHASAVTSAVISIIPVPFIESPIQIMMVRGIGKVYGQELDQKVVLEMLSVIGGNYLMRELLALIPYVGTFITITRVYATTWAIGATAEYYFKHGREVEKEELMRVFKTVLKQKTQEKEAEIKEKHIEERLKELQGLKEKALITPEEYDKKREAIISEL